LVAEKFEIAVLAVHWCMSVGVVR